MDENGVVFKEKVYLGRIKMGNQGFHDDVIGALVHNGRGGLSHSGLGKICKEEGYVFWGTDGLPAPEGEKEGFLTQKEFEDKMILLNHKLMGNPIVVKDRLISFLDLAILLLDQGVFVKESTKIILGAAVKERDAKRRAEALKVGGAKQILDGNKLATALKAARIVLDPRGDAATSDPDLEGDGDVILVDQEEYMQVLTEPAEVEVRTSKKGEGETPRKEKKKSPKGASNKNGSSANKSSSSSTVSPAPKTVKEDLPSVAPPAEVSSEAVPVSEGVKLDSNKSWLQTLADIDKIIMEEYKVSEARLAPSPSLKASREQLLKAGRDNIKLMADNDQLRRLLAAEKRAKVEDLLDPLAAKISGSIPEAFEKLLNKHVVWKLDYIGDMMSAIMTPADEEKEGGPSKEKGEIAPEATETPVVGESGVETQEVNSPEAKSQGVLTPETKAPEIKAPEIEAQEIEAPEIEALQVVVNMEGVARKGVGQEAEDRAEAGCVVGSIPEKSTEQRVPVGRPIKTLLTKPKNTKFSVAEFDPSKPPPPFVKEQNQAWDLSTPTLVKVNTPALTLVKVTPPVQDNPRKAARPTSASPASLPPPGGLDSSVRSVSRQGSPSSGSGFVEDKNKNVNGKRREDYYDKSQDYYDKSQDYHKEKKDYDGKREDIYGKRQDGYEKREYGHEKREGAHARGGAEARSRSRGRGQGGQEDRSRRGGAWRLGDRREGEGRDRSDKERDRSMRERADRDRSVRERADRDRDVRAQVVKRRLY